MASEWWLIIASGPSLQRRDCDTLRHHVQQAIAVNSAVFFVPWADYLYAGDAAWWKVYGPDIDWYKGRRVTHEKYKGLQEFSGSPFFRRFGGNSGHQALQFAVLQGARQIALLGFDHQRTGGKVHFHEDHKRYNEIDGETVVLGNANCIDHWPGIMASTAKDLEGLDVEVVNLTRETALTCFPRISVEEFISQS